MILKAFEGLSGRTLRLAAMGALVLVLSGCSLFGPQKLKEEAIVPDGVLYQTALDEMDKQRYLTAITALEQLSRQHPYSNFTERAKVMEVYANYRIGRFDEAILTAHMMLAAARALPGLSPGAHSLLDLPMSALWGEQAQTAERIWL